MTIEISVFDGASPALMTAAAQLTNQRINRICGAAARNEIRSHLRERGLQPNKNGWPKTGWYQRARDSVTMEFSESSAVVTIAMEGFRTRLLGDPAIIAPVTRKALTIPMCAEAYGRRAGEIKGLFFIRWEKGRTIGFLARRVNGQLQLMYRLVTSVTTHADPTLLPTSDEIQATCQAALQTAVMMALPR